MRSLVLTLLVPLIFTQLTLVCNDVLQIPLNSQFQYTLSASGGQQPYSYSATGMPTGISLVGNSISGYASTAGVFPVVVTVTDAKGGSSNKSIFAYVIAPNSATEVSSVKTTMTTSSTTNTSNSSNILGQTFPSMPSTSGVLTATQVGSNLQQAQTSNSGAAPAPYQGSYRNQALSNSFNGPIIPQSYSSNSGNQASSGNNYRTPPGSQVQSSTSSGYPTSQSPNNNLAGSYSPSNQSPQTGQQGSYPINNQSPDSSFPTNLVVPTTTPYITNYSFASTLQNSPTVSSQTTDALFQRQASVNQAISSLLALIQNYNATLLGLQANIPNTTSLLNDAIRNQRVAQAQVTAIVAQNTSIGNNISGIQSGIQTLQGQILSTTSTLNNSQAQVQGFQTSITQDYVQINDTQNKINQANNSLNNALNKQNQAAASINNSKNIILSSTQNITTIQNDITNAPIYLSRLNQSLNDQKNIILALQAQLQAAILALVPIQNQVDYYILIPTMGPGLIQQNRTLLAVQNSNLAQAQPIYDAATADIQNYASLLSQLTTLMSSLQNQLSADQLAYNNLKGAQSNQQGLFNNTLTTISMQTNQLNQVKQQQQNLLNGPYNAALQVVSDTTSKVNQLTSTLNSLNNKYQSTQTDLASTQTSLNQALQQKQLADQAVNQAIQSGSSLSSSSYTPTINTQSSGGVGQATISISGATSP